MYFSSFIFSQYLDIGKLIISHIFFIGMYIIYIGTFHILSSLLSFLESRFITILFSNIFHMDDLPPKDSEVESCSYGYADSEKFDRLRN